VEFSFAFSWMFAAPINPPYNPNGDVDVTPPPADSVSWISFSPTAPTFAATSWDKKARLYQYNPDRTTELKIEQTYTSPVLSCDFSEDGKKAYTGGCDKKVYSWDLESNKLNQIGQHDQPICFVSFSPSKNIIVTGSWDASIRYWDERSPTPIGTVLCGAPIACADQKAQAVVVAAGGSIIIINLDQPTSIFEKVEAPLKWQPRSIKIFPDARGYALSSIEGRVSIQHFNKVEHSKNFTFKCHRENTNVYAVNGMAFHPGGAFATVGSDGSFNFWDKDLKTRLKPFSKGNLPLTTCAFSRDGSIFGYAVGYDWAKGAGGYHPASQQPHILLHGVQDAEVKAKSRK